MAQVLDSPYGVTSALNDATSTIVPQLITDCGTLGLSWIRLQRNASLIWQNQSDPSTAWSWSILDDAVSRCIAAGLHISFVLRAMPAWAFGPGNVNSAQRTTLPNYVSDPAVAATYAAGVAARYNGAYNIPAYGPMKIDCLECGNEEYNLLFSSGATRGLFNSPFSIYNGLTQVDSNHQPGRDPHFYAPILKAQYNAIKANYPACKIGMCAMWWYYKENYTNFMQSLYTDGCRGYFDFINVHFYSNLTDPMTGGSPSIHTPAFTDMWTNFQAVIAANNDTGRPVWLTEIGWGTTGTPPDCTEAVQAARYQATLDSARYSGVLQKYMFFTLSGYNKPANQVDVSSLIQGGTGNLRYLPAFTTIQNYIQSYPQWPNSLTYYKTLPLQASSGVVPLQASSGALQLQASSGALPLQESIP